MVIIGQVTPPSAGLAFSGTNIQLKVGRQLIGSGTVYISPSSLIWQPVNDEQNGITIFWKRIGVHGISNTPSKCIYFMIDRQIRWPGVLEAAPGGNNENGGASDEEIFEDAEEAQITECWLLPDDINLVDTMYEAMTECQSLHPDSEQSVSEDMSEGLMEEDEEMNGDGFDSCNEDADEPNNGLGNGGEANSAGANMNNMPSEDDRFADADE